MNSRRNILILAAAVIIVVLLVFVSGCGDEEQASVECDVYSASILPAPSGKAQLIYFFSPT